MCAEHEGAASPREVSLNILLENILVDALSLKGLECSVSKLANSDTCPRYRLAEGEQHGLRVPPEHEDRRREQQVDGLLPLQQHAHLAGRRRRNFHPPSFVRSYGEP